MQKEQKSDRKKTEKLISQQKGTINAYMKYSGMGIQMALIIGAFAWLGLKADELLETDPVFTVILSLGGVSLSMFVFIKKVLSGENNNKIEK